MEMKKKATIVDVAKEAGVSVATVSRVVNGNYPVKPETRERVQSAINALQYVPNVQARELNTRHSSTIGVVVPGLYNMFFAEVIDGIEKSMRRQGYSLLLNCAQNDPELEMECINALVSRSVPGIIVISPNTEGLREEFYRRIVKRVPLVFINGYHRIPNVSYVANDEALGTRQFGKVYILLGINEIGAYTAADWAAQYKSLLDLVREKQPDAVIFIQSIFHTTQKKSDSSYFKNEVINERNAAIAQLADGKTIFYLDLNPLFDDENGALRADYSGDGVHVRAPYYVQWRDHLYQFGVVK